MVLINKMARDYKYICHYCDLISQDIKLPVCGQCKQIRYCSTDCQRIDWYEGGHKAICNSIKRDNEIIDRIERLTARVDDLSRSNNDLISRVCELEDSLQNKEPLEEIEEDTDYIREAYIELSRLGHGQSEPEYAEVEENSGYENNSCYGCELMMDGYTGRIYPNHHSCIRNTN
jgi:DNA repair exonuclease SbcCD ATPase subunit